MKMRFATPAFPGTYLQKSIPEDAILKRAAKNLRIRDEVLLHQAFIGDALNIIYLPLSIKDEKILDGVVDTSLAQIAEDDTPFKDIDIDRYAWKPVFISALCPQCGWNLEGEPDSEVLLCSNCNTGWQAGGQSFTEVMVKVTPAKDSNALFLPFWNFRVSAKGIPLNSFADFMRLTNQPFRISPEWDEAGAIFVSPAFKVRPDDFLRLATQMTISQRFSVQTTDDIPKKNLYPVTLAHNDADKGLKVILAHSALNRNAIFPHLPALELRVEEYFLHYLPFDKTSHELQQAELGVTINQRILNYGRSL